MIILPKLYISLIVVILTLILSCCQLCQSSTNKDTATYRNTLEVEEFDFCWLVDVNLKLELTRKINPYPGFVVFIFEARFEENNDKNY